MGSISTPKLAALGFCGVDDSVDPRQLIMYALSYPFVEFGVLFRPDKEGTPRYASSEWVDKLCSIVRSEGNHSGSSLNIRLAAHLCGSRVDEILRSGDSSFLSSINGVFGRCQINATAVNGVNTDDLGSCVPMLIKTVEQFPETEFIIQKNEETTALWEGILSKGKLPSNVTFLLDESKGTGVYAQGWSNSISQYSQSKIGYAGGIGPSNVNEVLTDLLQTNQIFWIDMESSLRSSKDGLDVFDLDKCYKCIAAAVDLNLYQHPVFTVSK